MRWALVVLVFVAGTVTAARLVRADDAGTTGTGSDGSSDASADAGQLAPDGSDGQDVDGSSGGGSTSSSASDEAGSTVACDGALCDTRSGAGCAIALPVVGASPKDPLVVTSTLALFGLALRRRIKRGTSCRGR
jgi:hypothetical protein